MNSQGDGLAIGSPLFPTGGSGWDDIGADVQYWTYDDITGFWSHTANLTSAESASAIFRMLAFASSVLICGSRILMQPGAAACGN